MVDAGTWKDLFHKRGTGVAILACRDAIRSSEIHSRLVTEHAICFPQDEDDESFLGVFIGKNSPILANVEAGESFSISFLRFQDREIAVKLAHSEREGIEWSYYPESQIPYINQCNFVLFGKKEVIVQMPGNGYSMLIGCLNQYWLNPEAGKPLLNNQQNWVTIDSETAVPVRPNDKNKRLRH